MPGKLLSSEASAPPTDDGPYLRLLQCFTCRSMEELPDFTGPPQYDVVLHHLDAAHGGAEDDPVRIHERALHRISERIWRDTAARRQIVTRMWEGRTGFVPSYYDTKDNLRTDAAKCFNKHLRPTERCPDWHHRSKRLGNPAAAERKDVGLDPHGGPRVYLCDFCPARAYMERRLNEERGTV